MLVRFEGDALGHEFIHDCKMTKNAAVKFVGEQYVSIVDYVCSNLASLSITESWSTKERERKPEGGKRKKKVAGTAKEIKSLVLEGRTVKNFGKEYEETEEKFSGTRSYQKTIITSSSSFLL